MNKVITIHLDGVAYQLEEGGYEALRAYLETAAERLKGNPDREEILADIEQAISDKFRGLLNTYKTVVLAREVEAVLSQMGAIENDADSPPGEPGSGASAKEGDRKTGDSSHEGSASRPVRRLYRIQDGAMLSGVCNGLGAYFNIDPTLVRIAFVLLTLLWGAGFLVYILMAIVVPSADSPEQKAAAYGAPFTAQEFIRRAKAGYYDTFSKFQEKQSRSQWKKKFQREMHGWSRAFQREMNANAARVRENWQRYWGPEVPPGAVYALPFFSLLHAIFAIAWIVAMVSLLATGKVFGTVELPTGMPAWVALLVLVLVYGFLTWPMRIVRRAFYSGPFIGPKWAVPFICVLDILVWLAVVVVVAWLGFNYLPEAEEALRNFPSVVQEAVEQIRQWWNQI